MMSGRVDKYSLSTYKVSLNEWVSFLWHLSYKTSQIYPRSVVDYRRLSPKQF